MGEDLVRPLFVVTSGLSLSGLLYLWRPLAGSLWRAEGLPYWILTLLFVAAIRGLAWAASFIDYPQFLGIRRNLREELGEVYDVYRAHVPMWIPRLSPWLRAAAPSRSGPGPPPASRA